MLTTNIPEWVASSDNLCHLLDKKLTSSNDFFISLSSGRKIDVPFPSNQLYECLWDCHEPDLQGSIKLEQAARLAEFIKDRRSKQQNLWVNCQAGISRSGAIVDILLRLGWTEHKHRHQETRFPNPTVWYAVAQFFPELEGQHPPYRTGEEWDDAIYLYLNPQQKRYFK